MQCREFSMMADLSRNKNSKFCNTLNQSMYPSIGKRHFTYQNEIAFKTQISCSHIESSRMTIIIANIDKIHTKYRSSHRVFYRCSIKISQIAPEKTCVGESVFNKVCQKVTPMQVFTTEIFKNFKNTYFEEHLSVNHCL